jgi:hypothetical protein
MKSNRLNHLYFVTGLGSVILLTAGCSDKKSMADASASVEKPAMSLAALPATPMTPQSDHPGVVTDAWDAIKNDTFAQRTHFSAGLKAMATGMDRQIAAMSAKQTGMGAMGDSKAEATKQETSAARANLQTASDKLSQATADTWASDKDRVAQAWMRMQTACPLPQAS